MRSATTLRRRWRRRPPRPAPTGSEKTVNEFVGGFDKNFKTAIDTIKAEQANAKSEIAKELEPLRKIRAEGETLDALVKKVQASTWFVRTLDEAGQPSVGTAFSVAS